MMKYAMRLIFAFIILLGLVGCAEPRFLTYTGPEVTHVVIKKSERRMYLIHENEVLRTYRIMLGRQPLGHKLQRGDARTPEGTYFIDRRNPNSQFHLSVGISYPNAEDVARAASLGVDPGGDIFIHGTPNRSYARRQLDWTYGCIAVTNREIEEIYAMVQDGTRVTIHP